MMGLRISPFLGESPERLRDEGEPHRVSGPTFHRIHRCVDGRLESRLGRRAYFAEPVDSPTERSTCHREAYLAA